jgi:hypothetical protein
MRGGIDKGPCVRYSRLSYRRKLIRTGWVALLGLPLLSVLHVGGVIPRGLRRFGVPDAETVGWGIVACCAGVCILQAWYNLYQWRRESRPGGVGNVQE